MMQTAGSSKDSRQGLNDHGMFLYIIKMNLASSAAAKSVGDLVALHLCCCCAPVYNHYLFQAHTALERTLI
jgi:hypothetical protein